MSALRRSLSLLLVAAALGCAKKSAPPTGGAPSVAPVTLLNVS
jgi:hypothetical protein